MIRLRERGAAFVVAALLAAGALLTMHIYTVAHSDPAVSHHTTSLAIHAEATASAEMSDHSTGGHSSHGLVECCFWLLLSGLVLYVVFRSFRLRLFSQIAPALAGMRTAPSQRAPPLTTRLSLVGVSRR